MGAESISPPYRYACGKRRKAKPVLKGEDIRGELEKIDDALRLIETKQVSDQPHRQGNFDSRSDMAESELGKFILEVFAQEKEEDRRSIYTSAVSYFNLVCSWRRHKGIPMPHRIINDSDREFLDEAELAKKIAWIGNKIRECDAAMGCGSAVRLNITKDLILDDDKPHPDLRGLVKIALLKLQEEF